MKQTVRRVLETRVIIYIIGDSYSRDIDSPYGCYAARSLKYIEKLKK